MTLLGEKEAIDFWKETYTKEFGQNIKTHPIDWGGDILYCEKDLWPKRVLKTLSKIEAQMSKITIQHYERTKAND